MKASPAIGSARKSSSSGRKRQKIISPAKPNRARRSDGDSNDALAAERRCEPIGPPTELQQAIQRYVDLFEFAPIGYVSFDRVGRVEEINLVAAQLLGWSRQRLIGAPFALCVARSDTQLFLRHLLRCRSSEMRADTELRLKKSDGTLLHVLLSSTPIYTSMRNGAALYQTAIVDLTERKRAEGRVAEQARLLDLSNDAIVVRDEHDRIVYWNHGATEIYGYTAEEALGKITHELLRTEYPQPMNEIREILARDGRWSGELVHTCKDGNKITVMSRWSLDRDAKGGPAAILETNTDISAHKRAEEQQQALYQFVQGQHAARSLPEIYSAALEAIISTLHCERAAILLFDRKGLIRFVGWRGLSTVYRRAIEHHSPWKPDAKNPQAICLADIDKSDLPKSLKSAIKGEGIRAAAFVPLESKGHLIGKFMAYYDAPHVFTEDDISSAVSIGRQLTLGLERRLAEEALRKSKLFLEQRVQQRTAALRATNRELQWEIERRKGLEGEILEVSDREQQRLAQELHDGLCQQLTAIGFMAQATALRLKVHRVVEVEDLEKIAQLITKSVNAAHNVARDLHKEEVDAATFPQALEDLVKREMWRTRCELQMRTELHLEDDRTASQLYRILREALINANKHSRASRIVLQVSRQKNDLVFSVTDNGVGFSPQKQSRGLGFHIMQYRARSIGARLKIESRVKGGARVACYVPQINGTD